MAAPTAPLETAIYTKLSTDSGIVTALGGTAIYNKRVPQNPPNKYIIMQWQGGGDENDRPHRARSVLYFVAGVADTQANAAALDTAIDAALHQGSLSATGWVNSWMARDRDINFVEEAGDGVTRYTVGGTYRIRIEEI